jgi:hypothetical protein
LRNNQLFARELVLELYGATGCQHAQRIVQVQAHGHVARSSADVERRADDRWCEDTQCGFPGQLNTHAPKIDRERNGVLCEQNRELSWAADVHHTPGEDLHPCRSRMHGDDAAV